jgi:hypothetical protein
MKSKYNIIIVFMILTLLPVSASKRSDVVQSLFHVVEDWMGTPYELGSKDKSGIDCSGFTSTVYSEVFNIEIPRSVSGQKLLGELVKDKLQPGDLIFFNIDGQISHVGIYVFDNKFIHAASAGPETGVIKSSLTENYYKTRFAYAKRIITLPEYEKEDRVAVDDGNVGDLKLDIIFGKTLYRNNIIDESSTFVCGKHVYFKVKSANNDPADFTVQFTNMDTNKVEKTMDLQIIRDDVNKFVDLSKGNYSVAVLKNNRQIIQKEIKVN